MFETPYTKSSIISYLQAVEREIGKVPTYRDLKAIPGPSPRTIVRHFGTWSKAIRSAKMRPYTHMIKHGDRTVIRKNWRAMTDKEIASRLNLTECSVKYYRMQYNLWKNRKGTSKQKHKADSIRRYGHNCEVCNIPIVEHHHIRPKSMEISDWSILCPTCHAVITRKLVIVNSREELQTVLKPYVMQLYQSIKFR